MSLQNSSPPQSPISSSYLQPQLSSSFLGKSSDLLDSPSPRGLDQLCLSSFPTDPFLSTTAIPVDPFQQPNFTNTPSPQLSNDDGLSSHSFSLYPQQHPSDSNDVAELLSFHSNPLDQTQSQQHPTQLTNYDQHINSVIENLPPHTSQSTSPPQSHSIHHSNQSSYPPPQNTTTTPRTPASELTLQDTSPIPSTPAIVPIASVTVPTQPIPMALSSGMVMPLPFVGGANSTILSQALQPTPMPVLQMKGTKRRRANGQWAHLPPDELKRIRRLRNRASVEKCRKKQRLKVEALQMERACLQSENLSMKSCLHEISCKAQGFFEECAAEFVQIEGEIGDLNVGQGMDIEDEDFEIEGEEELE